MPVGSDPAEDILVTFAFHVWCANIEAELELCVEVCQWCNIVELHILHFA